MPIAAITAVQALRAEQRQLVYGPMLPRLWRTMCDEWQRRRDRAMAQPLRLPLAANTDVPAWTAPQGR